MQLNLSQMSECLLDMGPATIPSNQATKYKCVMALVHTRIVLAALLTAEYSLLGAGALPCKQHHTFVCGDIMQGCTHLTSNRMLLYPSAEQPVCLGMDPLVIMSVAIAIHGTHASQSPPSMHAVHVEKCNPGLLWVVNLLPVLTFCHQRWRNVRSDDEDDC